MTWKVNDNEIDAVWNVDINMLLYRVAMAISEQDRKVKSILATSKKEIRKMLGSKITFVVCFYLFFLIFFHMQSV